MFRSLGLKSTGKHAAPKGQAPESREGAEGTAQPHRPAHAATMPRLTGTRAAKAHTGEQRAA